MAFNQLTEDKISASKLSEANRIETGVDSKAWLIVFDPSSLALDLFSENEVGVTIEFLFVPFAKQGVFSGLFRWEGPFPKLVDWSYWVLGTEVGGEISEHTIWTLDRSPYYVTSDVSVQSGVTLTVKPGVEVRFKKFSDFSGMKVGLSVHGNLVAEGTDEKPIVFITSCDFEYLDQMQGEWLEELQDWFPTDWKGIALGESGIFNYCVVEYGEANIRGGTSLQVSNSYIKGGVDGINFFGVSGAIINNTITRNGFAAISCGGGTTTVSGNTITVRRGHGAIHHATGQAEITDNTISVEMDLDTFAYWGILCRMANPNHWGVQGRFLSSQPGAIAAATVVHSLPLPRLRKRQSVCFTPTPPRRRIQRATNSPSLCLMVQQV